MNSPYDHLKQVAATAVICGDSVLLGKRALVYRGTPIPYAGYWSLFGGAVEEGESPLTAAVRELEEETRIKTSLVHLEYRKTLSFFAEDGSDQIIEFTIYVLRLKERPTPILDEEHSEYGWFKISSLQSVTEKIDPKIVEVLLEV